MSEKTVPFAIYDGFSENLFGGSQGGIVLEAGDIDARTRQSIASELGLPATCFVTSVKGHTVTARFHSTVREYPMCGHGTICLMTHLWQLGLLPTPTKDRMDVELVLPTQTAPVEMLFHDDDTVMVMLDIAAPKFRDDKPDYIVLASLFGLQESDIDSSHPAETALGDFVHLIVPIKALKAMQSIQADFSAIKSYCRENDFETIACFSSETMRTECDFHVRDFCPAVGVDESAAAGTTNAALAAYWHNHGFIAGNGTGLNEICVEQGLELGRPSSIHTIIHSKDNEITRLQVGGVARKVIEGQLQLPQEETNLT